MARQSLKRFPGVSVLIGLFSGFHLARRGAGLDPFEALRSQ